MSSHFLRGEKSGESIVLKESTALPVAAPSGRRKITTQAEGFQSVDDGLRFRRIDHEGNWTFKQVTMPTIVANQDDWAIGTGAFFLISGAGTWTISGIAGGLEGRRIVMCYTGAFSVRFLDDDAASTAANRFYLGTSFVQLNINDSIELIYDSTASRWRRIGTTT